MGKILIKLFLKCWGCYYGYCSMYNYLFKIIAGSDGGVSYNIGALYGAGFFVCAMVICLTIICNILILNFSITYTYCC